MKFVRIACLLIIVTLYNVSAFAQDSTNNQITRTIYGDPDANKIIPDKVYEFGIPLLFIFFVLNTIVSIYKTRLEFRLKQDALNKGFSEQGLTQMFKEDQIFSRFVFLKWFLVLLSLGISLIIVHILAYSANIRSGYLALGIIMACMSLAFLIYFRIIKDK